LATVREKKIVKKQITFRENYSVLSNPSKQKLSKINMTPQTPQPYEPRTPPVIQLSSSTRVLALSTLRGKTPANICSATTSAYFSTKKTVSHRYAQPSKSPRCEPITTETLHKRKTNSIRSSARYTKRIAPMKPKSLSSCEEDFDVTDMEERPKTQTTRNFEQKQALQLAQSLPSLSLILPKTPHAKSRAQLDLTQPKGNYYSINEFPTIESIEKNHSAAKTRNTPRPTHTWKNPQSCSLLRTSQDVPLAQNCN